MTRDNMTNNSSRESIAEAFNRDLDPLEKLAGTFEQLEEDPFEVFWESDKAPQNLARKTRLSWERSFDYWEKHMASEGRHPACPNEGHVRTFIQHLREDRGHVPRTIRKRLNHLNSAYEFWQRDAAFPHPNDYNPFESAREKVDLRDSESKQFPRITLQELRECVDSISHVRDHAIVVLQLKLGLRRMEVCNMKLSEVTIQNPDLQEHYDEMGTHRQLEGRENAIYIPPAREREGNKSKRPRVLPLDDETRHVLTRYLLMRPDVSQPWLFLSKTNHAQLDGKDVNRAWEEGFRPEYAETDEHRAINSHFGRHWFSTHWGVRDELGRENLKYMRGDITDDKVEGGREAIDEYLHTYYEDIESPYRERIFKLNV